MSTFEKWFLAQHGPRMTDNKITDSDLAEMIEEGARAEADAEKSVEGLRLRDYQLEYSIKLQRLIEAFCWGADPLPYPELYHSRKLTAWRLTVEKLRS